MLVYSGAINAAIANNVVTVAFPVFAEDFHTSPAVVSWVAIAYTLTSASLLTTFGRLSDMRGRRRLYALGVAIFLTGSVLCSTSGNIPQLIACRVLQGVGSSLVTANSLAYLVEIYPGNRRGAIVGLWEACIGAGIAIGPVIGGGLLSAFGWRAVFYVSVPASAAILALIPRFMFEPDRPRRAQRFDFIGSGFFAIGVATLLFAFSEGYDQGWTSPIILGCLSCFVVCAVAFVATELHHRQPMVDLAIFRNKTFSAGNAAKLFAYLPFTSHSFLLPFYLEKGAGLTPATVGLWLTPLPIAMICSSLFFGPLSDKIGARKLAPAGCFAQGLAALLMTQVSPARGFALLAVAMVLAGAGIGAFIAPNDSSILSATPSDKLGVANGIMGISRQLGIVMGYSVAAGLLSARLVANGGEFTPSFHQVYILVAGVAFCGIFFAAVRQKQRPASAAMLAPTAG